MSNRRNVYYDRGGTGEKRKRTSRGWGKLYSYKCLECVSEGGGGAFVIKGFKIFLRKHATWTVDKKCHHNFQKDNPPRETAFISMHESSTVWLVTGETMAEHSRRPHVTTEMWLLWEPWTTFLGAEEIQPKPSFNKLLIQIERSENRLKINGKRRRRNDRITSWNVINAWWSVFQIWCKEKCTLLHAMRPETWWWWLRIFSLKTLLLCGGSQPFFSTRHYACNYTLVHDLWNMFSIKFLSFLSLKTCGSRICLHFWTL